MTKMTIGYVRVSTTQQADEGYGLEAQRRKINAYCELHDLVLTEIVEDAGLSGKSIKGRPGIQRILSLVKVGKVDNVIVAKLDRLARNVKEACEISELLEKKKAALHSVAERLDTGSANGRLFFNIMNTLATWEREVIGERTVAALAVKKSQGQRISGEAPYGYQFDKDGNVVMNDDEQTVIAKVRELQGQGHTIRGIVEWLKDHGYKNRKGNPVGRTEVWKILHAA
ncbi:MAG: recombinase family protein [Pseudomonadota bacterium]